MLYITTRTNIRHDISIGVCYVDTPCNIDRGQQYEGTASSGASIESQPSVSEEEEADDSPSLEHGGRAAREVR